MPGTFTAAIKTLTPISKFSSKAWDWAYERDRQAASAFSFFCGASYVSALPKLAGPHSCYRIRGDFFKINEQLWKVSSVK
nr:hypothetical protein [Mucilaginibacter sp. X4EP1]